MNEVLPIGAGAIVLALAAVMVLSAVVRARARRTNTQPQRQAIRQQAPVLIAAVVLGIVAVVAGVALLRN